MPKPVRADRLCLFCAHFWLDAGLAAWGDETPGSRFGMGCNKNKWEFNADGQTENDYREIMLIAESCTEFVRGE